MEFFAGAAAVAKGGSVLAALGGPVTLAAGGVLMAGYMLHKMTDRKPYLHLDDSYSFRSSASLDSSGSIMCERSTCCDNSHSDSFDFKNCSMSGSVFPGAHQLSSVDTSQRPCRQSIFPGAHQLSSVDTSQRPCRQSIFPGAHQLSSVDTSQRPCRQSIFPGAHQLSSVDTSQRPCRQRIFPGAHQLSSVDISARMRENRGGAPPLACLIDLDADADCNGSTSNNSGGSQSNQQGSKNGKHGLQDKDSSEVANELNAGGAGSYKDARKRRQSPERDDGYRRSMEADHIPPLDSWRRARHHPEFDSLRHINPALYEMACSLENDPRGENLPTIEVPRQSHRVNLTTGNSTESRSVRALLADYIARGEAERMLRLAFIVAHPVASNQIRRDAGLSERRSVAIVEFREGRILTMYRRGFLDLLELYHRRGVINQEELERLRKFVKRDRFLNTKSHEYQEILRNVLESMKRRNQS